MGRPLASAPMPTPSTTPKKRSAAARTKQPAPLLTRAEATNFAETSRHAEVLAFCDALAAQSPLVHRTSLGKSGEGQDIAALVVSDRKAFTPELARKQGKVVVMVEANIHAGEVEGKEMVLALARDLATTKLGKGLLDKLVLVLVPDFNPDGNDRISPGNRKLDLANLEGQVNPPGGVGTRYTGEGWNLNRDSMKQEAPETRAMATFFQAWWPELFIDCHTTDGSLHRHDLTFDTSRGNEPLFADQRIHARRMLETVSDRVRQGHGFESTWYGNFVKEEEPSSGWHTYPALPRFGSHYRGLLGRFDVLLETYSYISFERRCAVIRAWMLELFRFAAKNAVAMKELCENAMERTVQRGAEPDARQLVAIGHGVGRRDEKGALRFDYPAHSFDDDTVEILSFDKPSLAARRYPGKKEVTYRVPHLRGFAPTRVATTPRAWLCPASLAPRLAGHGIDFEVLSGAQEIAVESHRVLHVEQTFSPDVKGLVPAKGQSEVPLSAKPPPSRFESVLTTRLERGLQRFPTGTLWVPSNQRAGTLAVYLLEPESDDGFARWQLLDGQYEVGGFFPIHRVVDVVEPRFKGE